MLQRTIAVRQYERDNRHSGARTVDQLPAVVDNPLDLALLLQVSDSNPRQRAVDLEPLNEDALRDEAERRDFLHDAVVQGLVQRNGVLGLVLDLALGPLLLLCRLAAARGCGGCLCFGLCKMARSAIRVIRGALDPSSITPASERRIQRDERFLQPQGGHLDGRQDAHHVLAGPVVVVVALSPPPAFLEQMLTKRPGRLMRSRLGRVGRFPPTLLVPRHVLRVC